MFIKSINNIFLIFATHCFITANVMVESVPMSGSFSASNPSSSATCLDPIESGLVVSRTMNWDDSTTSVFNLTLTTSATLSLLVISLNGVVISEQFNGYRVSIISTLVNLGFNCLSSGISSISGTTVIELISLSETVSFTCAGNVTINYSPALNLTAVLRTVSTENDYSGCILVDL